MVSPTLTLLDSDCSYIHGTVHVQTFTNEPCLLDLLYTQTKPTRKAVFEERNSKRVVHSYRYQMRDVKRIPEQSALPTTIHHWFFDFPQLSDILYYIHLQQGQEPDDGPQTPLFAWRIPLRLLYTVDLATDPPDVTWTSFSDPPHSNIFPSPGALGITAVDGFRPQAWLQHQLSSEFGYPGLDADGVFILFDAAWFNRNNTDEPNYFAWLELLNGAATEGQSWGYYGDISMNPCPGLIALFAGHFRPHEGTLFCVDLLTLRTEDLCGTPITPLVNPRIFFFRDWVLKLANASTQPSVGSVLHNYAIYVRTGNFQFLGRRWPYFRPLLPQIGGPKLTQRPLRT